MKTRTKIFSLVMLFLFVFALALAVQVYFEKRQISMIFLRERKERAKLFDKISDLRGKSLETVAIDYTYWDESVDFVKNPNKTWAEENLDTTFGTFNIDGLWIYNLDFSLVYSSNTLEDNNIKEFFLSKEVLKKLFEQNRLSHFFVDSPKGVWEIRAATMHRSNDPERKNPPEGYFIVGRLWSEKLIQELSFYVSAEVRITDPQAAAAAAAAAEVSLKNVPQKGGEIVFYKELNGWDGLPVAGLKIAEKSLSIEGFKLLSQRIYSTIAFLFIYILVVTVLFFTHFVSIPLRLISESLSSENADIVKKLLSRQDEFGGIARLIQKFFQQRSELDKKSQEAEKAVELEKMRAEELANIQEATLNMLEDMQETNIQLKLSQDQLIQSAKLASLGELISKMAHEVNNPLMIISGNAQLCLMEELRDKNLEKNLKVIVEQTDRAKDIIQRLLLFSRSSRGEITEVDINEAFEFVIKLVEHQYEISNVKIIRDYGSGLPTIELDSKQMQQVFMNLLRNAAEAMPEGGSITVSTSRIDDKLVIAVKDTGCGIPKENLSKLFEPFFTTKPKGTGLGLPVSYGIVRAHGGEIKIDSEAGRGLTVTILIPIRQPEKKT